jgi:hypothetical protein
MKGLLTSAIALCLLPLGLSGQSTVPQPGTLVRPRFDGRLS